MKQFAARTALTIAVLALTTTAAFAAEATFQRTLSVSGTAQLQVGTGSGYIHITPGSDNQVHIVGHVRSSNSWFGGDANARVQQIVSNPPITQSGNSIQIGTNHSDWSMFRNISIDYDITTPKSSTIKASSGSGDVQISNISGVVAASTGSGDVRVQNIGANARLETGSGTIDANGINGAAYLETGSGDIHMQQTSAGDVKAQTGSGSIRLQGISGGLKAGTGSGDLEVAGQPTQDWKLETGSGSIRLTLGNSAKFTLNAETGSGTVHVSQPITMQGDINRHHVRGAVNGGGPILHAETGSGDITIQ
ncbi:MAG: DUF4097 family beta strand repeat-containing protein [Acidobacteriaceae bacterium]